MKFLKHLFFVTILALSGTARADLPWVPMDPGAPGQFTNYWTFNSATGSAGDIEDYFVFNLPDTERISLKAVTTAGTINFLGGGAAIFELGSGTVIGYTYASSSAGFQTDSWTLSSGVYGFQILGNRTTDGATYNAVVMGLPVPEPTSIVMLLAGLAMLAAVTRLRNGKI